MKRQLISSLIAIGLSAGSKLYASVPSKVANQSTSVRPPCPDPDSGDWPVALASTRPPCPDPDSGDWPTAAASSRPPCPDPDSGDWPVAV